MKKSLFSTILCLAISSLSFGQFNIIDTSGKLVNNDTVVVFGDATHEMIVSFNVINTGLDTVNVYARRDSINTPAPFDSNNTFCWGLCYSFGDPNNVSQGGEVLNRGGSSGDTSYSAFIGYYVARGHVGAAFIRYTFYAARNRADSSWVMVKYDATPAGIQNISGVNSSFSAYPNPASNLVSFNYKISNGVQSANLKIFNLIGECVQTLPLSALKSKTILDVQSMPSGIYVCEMQAQGSQPVYQKLVVSH